MTQQLQYDVHAQRIQTLKDIAGSLVVLAVLGAIMGGAFYGVHTLLMSHGLSSDLKHSAYLWVGAGAVCSLFWPLRYFQGMRGHWGPALPAMLVLSLTGPFALLLGFPL